MTFPAVELKFSQIMRTDAATMLLLRLYRLDDGGIVNGSQVVLRTLKRERGLSLPAGVTKAQVLSQAQQKLSDWATELGLTGDQVCTL